MPGRTITGKRRIDTMNQSLQYSFSRILCFSVCYMLVSCVSQLKYKRVSEEVVSLRNEREVNLKLAESLKIQLEKTSKELADLKDENQALKRDSTQSGSLYRRSKELLDDVFDKYDRLNKSYNTLLANSSTEEKESDQEISQKEKQILDLSRELEEMKVQINKAQAELDSKKRETEKLNLVVGQKDEAIREMQTQIISREKLISEFKARMDAAVKDLNDADLMVTQKNGRVHVNIPNRSLFGAGEFSLQEAGKEALKKVALVLNQNEEFEVSVEGHTDISPYRPVVNTTPNPVKKPVKGKSKQKGKQVPPENSVVPKSSEIKDNWDLSAIRAASVARELYLLGIAGDRISATGKGEFYPLDKTLSDDARRRNRRIEIVISPRMQMVMKLLETEKTR